MRLVHGSLGPFLANHALRAARRDDRPGSSCREAGNGSNDDDEKIDIATIEAARRGAKTDT